MNDTSIRHAGLATLAESPHRFVESGPGQEPPTIKGCIVCRDCFQTKRASIHEVGAIHYTKLVSGQRFRLYGNLFEVASEAKVYPNHGCAGSTAVAFDARCVEVGGMSMAPWVKNPGDMWSMQIRTDLAYMKPSTTEPDVLVALNF